MGVIGTYHKVEAGFGLFVLIVCIVTGLIVFLPFLSIVVDIKKILIAIAVIVLFYFLYKKYNRKHHYHHHHHH